MSRRVCRTDEASRISDAKQIKNRAKVNTPTKDGPTGQMTEEKEMRHWFSLLRFTLVVILFIMSIGAGWAHYFSSGYKSTKTCFSSRWHIQQKNPNNRVPPEAKKKENIGRRKRKQGKTE